MSDRVKKLLIVEPTSAYQTFRFHRDLRIRNKWETLQIKPIAKDVFASSVFRPFSLYGAEIVNKYGFKIASHDYRAWLNGHITLLGRNMASDFLQSGQDAVIVRSGDAIDLLATLSANRFLAEQGRKPVPIMFEVGHRLMRGLETEMFLKGISTDQSYGHSENPSNLNISLRAVPALLDMANSRAVGPAAHAMIRGLINPTTTGYFTMLVEALPFVGALLFDTFKYFRSFGALIDLTEQVASIEIFVLKDDATEDEIRETRSTLFPEIIERASEKEVPLMKPDQIVKALSGAKIVRLDPSSVRERLKEISISDPEVRAHRNLLFNLVHDGLAGLRSVEDIQSAADGLVYLTKPERRR